MKSVCARRAFDATTVENRIENHPSQLIGVIGRGSSSDLQNTKSSGPIFLEPSRCLTRVRSRDPGICLTCSWPVFVESCSRPLQKLFPKVIAFASQSMSFH